MITTTKNIPFISKLKKLKLNTILLSALLINTAINSTFVSAKTLDKSVTCFDNVKVEANFLAFNTAKNSDLANWYQRVFSLKTVKEFAFPDGKTTGILMHKDDFIIEVFFKQHLLEAEQQVSQSAAELSTSKEKQGINKVGIFTNADLPVLKKCLVNTGVNATRIWHDKNLAIDLLQVIDPDGNVLELIARS